jgi:hypothetical protein
MSFVFAVSNDGRYGTTRRVRLADVHRDQNGPVVADQGATSRGRGVWLHV